MSVGIGRQNIIICFGNNEAAQQFYFREYINENQTFILDSHTGPSFAVWYILYDNMSIPTYSLSLSERGGRVKGGLGLYKCTFWI
jgi:hypothetical protein